MFRFQTTIRFHHTDAAGVMFFANQFTLVHDAYEALMESIGFPLARILAAGEYVLPIVHAVADFNAPLGAGESVEIQLTLVRLGETSLTLGHRMFADTNRLVGEGETVHVCVDVQTREKRRWPSMLRRALETV